MKMRELFPGCMAGSMDDFLDDATMEELKSKVNESNQVETNPDSSFAEDIQTLMRVWDLSIQYFRVKYPNLSQEAIYQITRAMLEKRMGIGL